ncbi:MAG: hypothetical protein Q9207_005337 [Kuettlingeria erythrocarpa]
MSAISENNDPTNPPYKFIINCTPTGDVLDDCSESYAITDATIPKDDNDLKSIWLCPQFFNGGIDSKNDLPNPSDKEALKEWCDQPDYTSLPTAGPYFP